MHYVITEGQTTIAVECLKSRTLNYCWHLGQGHLKQYVEGLRESNFDEKFVQNMSIIVNFIE